jgi:SOS-response transcriptional repressor LexA
MNPTPGQCRPASNFSVTPKQSQYLAFIHAYTLVLGRPPAQADMQRHFRVTPPSVHQMILTLERKGLIRRLPGVARSIEVLVDPEALPPLQPSLLQPVKSSVQRYYVAAALPRKSRGS